MTPQDNKSWEESFDEKFAYFKDIYSEELIDIKSFIHSTLNKEKEQERNRLIEKVEGEKKSLLGDMAYTGGDLPKKYIAFQRSGDIHYDSYNRAISDILSVIKEKEMGNMIL